MRMEKTTHLWPKRRQHLLGLFFCFAPSLSSSSSPSSSSPPVSWLFVPLSVPVPWRYRPVSLLPVSTLRAVIRGGRWGCCGGGGGGSSFVVRRCPLPLMVRHHLRRCPPFVPQVPVSCWSLVVPLPVFPRCRLLAPAIHPTSSGSQG